MSSTNTSSSDGASTRKPVTATPRVHARRDHVLRRDGAQAARRGASPLDHLAQAQAAQDRGGLARPVAVDDGQRLGAAPDLVGGALAQQVPGVHHAEVGAHLLDLGQQVAGDEHRGALGGHRGHERADLAGALRVEAVGGLVEHEQVARAHQGAGDGEALAHAEGVRAVALARGREQPDPLEGRLDPGPGGAGRVVTSAASRRTRLSRPERYGWKAGPSTRAPTRARTSPDRSGTRSPSTSIAPDVGPTSPSSIRIVVVLPEPLGPRNP